MEIRERDRSTAWHRAAPAVVVVVALVLSALSVRLFDAGELLPITHEYAQMLYDRVRVIRGADGCQLTRFDASDDGIAIGLQGRTGTELGIQLNTSQRAGDTQWIGRWSVKIDANVERECADTLAAMRALLEKTPPPRTAGGMARLSAVFQSNYDLLAASFLLLVLGSLDILYRAVRTERPPAGAVLMLVAIWGVGLALRLSVSPPTFLHEYYHIAETISGYLTGNAAPAYGQTGPALFRLVGSAVGRPNDVQVIFLTNAVLASLAIPAVALLDLALLGRWEHAICAALLLCVLPQHLRFSAAEDIFIQAVTFGMWALALWAWYFRRPRLELALIGAVALSLAVQTRPEMLFFPAALFAMVLLVQADAWRLLYNWRTIVAALVAGALLIPRALEMQQLLASGGSPAPSAPNLGRYFRNLVVFHGDVTPLIMWVLLAAGTLWTAWRKPALLLWVAALYVGWTLFSHTMFANPPFDLRSQLLPTSFLVLIAAGAASLWTELWGPAHRRTATAVGATMLAASAIAIVVSYHGFVTELRDQQREWNFLERTVPLLPEQGTLLSTIRVGGDSLDAFPTFLLERDAKQYRLVDLGAAADGGVGWPSAGEDVYFYQGMFCYFAFPESEPTPDPMTPRCLAVHDRYVTQPLFVEDLDTPGFSWLRYAPGPYRIGFYRLIAAR